MRCDVAILGGGMAAGLLARQLGRACPGLRVAVLERDPAPSYKVGESLVEMGSHYLIRRLGLSRYLYEHHLPKNGLRYFFDTERADAALTQMSEVGTVNLPFHPAFQVDRARLDADLRAMNAEAGAEIREGWSVEDVELAEGSEPHRVRAARAGGRETLEADWLVDATGRTGLLARKLGLRERESAHRTGAVWGRFTGVLDLDDLPDEDFRARVRHTSRGISTIHFCYRGYWVWLIPLRGGVTSVGVVGHPPAERARLRTAEGFRAFLEGHRALRELLAKAELLDARAYASYSYGTKRFLSGGGRYALVGEAASFADPLYSPGADFMALENDFVSDLVARERAGEGADVVANRAELFDRFLRFRHEAAMRLYRGQYGVLGSFELMKLKWDFDIGCYYNLWVSPYMQDLHLDERELRRQLRMEGPVLRALANFGDLFRKVEARLHASGAYHRANLGRFAHGLEHIDFVEEVGRPRSRRAVLEKTAEIFNGVRARALPLLGEESPVEPEPLTRFLRDRALA